MTDPATLAFRRHDHRRCRDRITDAVEGNCARRGLRLTALRRRTLDILLEEHRAFGAYEVLARLSEDGAPAHPPVAYRALDFLVANGFAHRIERMNAYIACPVPGAAHRPAFLICRDCRAVAETPVPEMADPIDAAARDAGFAVEAISVEVEGLCPSCACD